MSTTFNGMFGGTIQTLSDDFQFGSSEAGEVGELGWNSGSAGGTGNTNGVPSELDHPGIMSVNTSATAGSRFHVSGSGLHVLNAKRFMTLIRIPVPNVQVRFGLFATITASGEDSRGVYFSYDPATSPRWRSVTRDVNGITVKEFQGRVGPVVADKWFLLDLQLEPGYVIFRLNNREEARHQTNIPVEMVDKGWCVQNIDAAVRTIHIDYFFQRLVTSADARF